MKLPPAVFFGAAPAEAARVSCPAAGAAAAGFFHAGTAAGEL